LATITPLKAIALLIFLGAIVGAAYGVSAVLGDKTASAAINAEPLRAAINATPGHSVTFPVKIVNRGATSQDLSAAVTGLGDEARSATVTTLGSGNRTVFVTLDVPTNATPGEHVLGIKVMDAHGATVRTREGALRLNVLSASNGFASGDSANVVYTGRISATGNVFSTNDPALAGQSFGHTDTFPTTVNTRPLPVQTVPRVSVVEGFYEGMLGMVAGETRTLTFGPEKGYGNATVEQTEARTVTIPHNQTLPLPGASLSPTDFAGYLQGTGQGNAADYKVGDLVTNTRNGQTLRYKIVSMTDAEVRLTLDVHVGERYTVHEFWPNASVVVGADANNVTFRTDPPVEPNQTFTYDPSWPNMSAITSMNETSIVITHSPTVGLQFQKTASQASGPQTYTVKELTATSIVETTANPNQLAGKDLTFDITVLDLTKAS
jgi:FKBP-type peptidyl-prolyl cis-trans isomerase 2